MRTPTGKPIVFPIDTNWLHKLEAVVLDVLIIFVAYVSVLSVRAATTEIDYVEAFKIILFAALIHVAYLYASGVYRRIWSMTSGNEVITIIYPTVLTTATLCILDLLLPQRSLPLSVVIVSSMLINTGLVAVRFRSRLIAGLVWRLDTMPWRNQTKLNSLTRVLIVGAGDSGQMAATRFKNGYVRQDQAYQVVGFVDDDVKKQGSFIEGHQVLGSYDDIPQLAEKFNIDLIVIALHQVSGPDIRKIYKLCEQTKALLKVVPDMFALVNAKQNATVLRDLEAQDLVGRSNIGRHPDIDLSHVEKKVALVTGAAGSIGSELCRQLCILSVSKLIMLDNNESNLHELHIELGTQFPSVELVPVLADITLRDEVQDVFDDYKPQIVFHAAAYKHVPMLERHPEQAVRVNIGGTRNVAEIASESNVERFVLISTDKAVDPSSVMGASKWACEMLMRAVSQRGSKTLFASVRFGNVLGSRGSVAPTFNRQIDNGGPITITDDRMTRFFMSIPEAANLVVQAACLTKGNDTFLLRMGEEIRIVELAERMIRLRGLRPNVDIEIKITGTRPGEKLQEKLHGTGEIPSDTAHPGIIELKRIDNTFDAKVFLENVDRLDVSTIHSAASLVNALSYQPAKEIIVKEVAEPAFA